MKEIYGFFLKQSQMWKVWSNFFMILC